MYETKYSGKTPKKVGEQHGTKYAPDGAAPEYQQVGSKTSYPDKSGTHGPNKRHKNKETPRNPYLNGGGNKQVSASYASKTHANFGTEGARNTLISPTSRPPKKA
jgi:hypothetical protein